MQNDCNYSFTTYENEIKENSDYLKNDTNQIFYGSEAKKSKLYHRFLYIKKKVERELTEDGLVENDYFDDNYLQDFIDKCVPFIPLWTPVVNYKLKNGVEIRLSNATVESWFKTIKVDIFQGSLRQKCGRFLRTMRERVQIVCKQVDCKIRKKRMTRPNKDREVAKKLSFENSEDNCIDAVEQWGKKEKQSKHLKSKSFRPFKTESLKTQNPVDDVVCVLDSPPQSLTLSRCSTNNTIVKSSSTPFNQTTIGCIPEKELYSNGLPKDLMYYQKMVLPDGTLKNDYIVGLYGYVCKQKKCDFITDLDFREFDTLSENNWLSNFVIDICLATYLVKVSSPNVKIISTNTVRLLMMKRDYGEEYDEKIKVSNNNIVLMPWRVNDHHWILLVINIEMKMFTIMDTLNTNERIKMIRLREVHRVLFSNFVYNDV
ncbi:hypothetical protein ACI65C_013537 [Semiaphis heraclei]